MKRQSMAQRNTYIFKGPKLARFSSVYLWEWWGRDSNWDQRYTWGLQKHLQNFI